MLNQKQESIYDFTILELQQKLIEIGLKKYIAIQIFDWLYKKFATSFDEMSNISEINKEILKQNFYIEKFYIDKIKIDKNDETVKFLFKLHDNNFIETVLMKFNYGYSVCLTSQVGCNMGCNFCASGLLTKKRNLTVSEFICQVIHVNNYLLENYKEKLSHIVIMGIGEPFDNFDNLVKFIEIAKYQKGLCISPRRITVSTCGLVHKIKEWADLNNQVNLAISLHAPNDEIRSKLMRINKTFPIKKVIEAMDYYIQKTNRRVTIEYILIANINDSKENAIELANLLKNKLCYVNIIPYNKVFETEYSRSKKSLYFCDILKSNGLTCTVRLEKGGSIDAACGQLRSRREKMNA